MFLIYFLNILIISEKKENKHCLSVQFRVLNRSNYVGVSSAS